jgi:hypothetical protein
MRRLFCDRVVKISVFATFSGPTEGRKVGAEQDRDLMVQRLPEEWAALYGGSQADKLNDRFSARISAAGVAQHHLVNAIQIRFR